MKSRSWAYHAVIFLLLLVAGIPAFAASGNLAGRWALHTQGQTLLLLELKRESGAPGGWSGALSRPERFEISEMQLFSNVGGPVVKRRVLQASERNGGLELVMEGAAPGQSSQFMFKMADEGFGELSLKGAPIPPFTLVPAAPGEAVGTRWVAARSYAPDWERPANAEMAQIFQADQAARQNPAQIDWKVLTPQDEERRRRTKALLDAGKLQAGDDFYQAAFVFQHGDKPEDFLLAHNLAIAAIARGRRDGTWIAAAALDRYLQEIGQKQIYGTQFKTPSGQPASQEPYDRALISDALRSFMGVPPLAAQEEQRKLFEDMFRKKK